MLMVYVSLRTTIMDQNQRYIEPCILSPTVAINRLWERTVKVVFFLYDFFPFLNSRILSASAIPVGYELHILV